MALGCLSVCYRSDHCDCRCGHGQKPDFVRTGGKSLDRPAGVNLVIVLSASPARSRNGVVRPGKKPEFLFPYFVSVSTLSQKDFSSSSFGKRKNAEVQKRIFVHRCKSELTHP